jgi:hypothetical protein
LKSGTVLASLERLPSGLCGLLLLGACLRLARGAALLLPSWPSEAPAVEAVADDVLLPPPELSME